MPAIAVLRKADTALCRTARNMTVRVLPGRISDLPRTETVRDRGKDLPITRGRAKGLLTARTRDRGNVLLTTVTIRGKDLPITRGRAKGLLITMTIRGNVLLMARVKVRVRAKGLLTARTKVRARDNGLHLTETGRQGRIGRLLHATDSADLLSA